MGKKKPSSLFLEGCLKSIDRISTRKLCRLLAITFFVPRRVWWSSCLKSLLAIIYHRCPSVEKTKLQEALKKSQGGILEGRTVDHLILNYNQDEIVHRERKAVNAMVRFFGEWTREEREVTKLASLLIDEIPKSVYSYYTNWRENIANDASYRCGFQIIVSDITVQHLTVYFAHRGGKGNLGKKHSAAALAKMMGKKRSAATRAKISEAMTGKKHSAATRGRQALTKTGGEGWHEEADGRAHSEA